jgi:hypothetical protein
MIQRIQTVYLVLGTLALIALALFDNFWNSQAAGTLVWFLPLLLVVWGAAIALGLYSIFLYSDRKRQERRVFTAQLSTLTLMVVLYGGLYLGDELLVVTGEGTHAGRLFLLLLPIVTYVLFYLARRAIRSDIELVRSMDRLR